MLLRSLVIYSNEQRFPTGDRANQSTTLIRSTLEMDPNGYINPLLHCRYAIVRDMTAAGLGLNKFCYAGIITAHKNKTPLPDDTASKVITKYYYLIFFEVYSWILLVHLTS